MSIDEEALRKAWANVPPAYRPHVRRIVEEYEAFKAPDQPVECRTAFEARYPTDTDKRALQKNDDGHYILMQTYTQWVAFQAGWEARDSVRESVTQALAMLHSMIDGGEECRGRDSEISDIIRLLEQGR